MPRKPTEFDLVESLLQQAARAIRDSQQGDLETEKVRSAIYAHICDAINVCANFAFTRDVDSPHPYSLTSPPAPPAGGRGGGGVGGRRGGTDRGQHIPASTKDIVLDLDILK